jgi:NADPH:quinone reductase-like Zn-dependent oxidoreductase
MLLMKAILSRRYGPADVMEMADVPTPVIGPHEILVRVRASSVNPVDWKVRRGMLRPITGVHPPKVLGADFAGEVERIGDEVERYAVGDEVYGMVPALKGGAYAEKVVVRPKQIAPMPNNLSFEQAAVLPLVALTVHQVFFRRARQTPDQHLLVNGCAGGLGHIAVQMGKALGYRVTGVCSTRNLEVAKQLGADAVIDYTLGSPLAGEQRYDLIFDAVANLDFGRAKHILTPNGIYVSSIPSPTNMLAAPVLNRFRTKKHRTVRVAPDGVSLRQVTEMVEAGQINPIIEKTYPLNEIREAHAHSETGRVVGKLALRVGS